MKALVAAIWLTLLPAGNAAGAEGPEAGPAREAAAQEAQRRAAGDAASADALLLRAMLLYESAFQADQQLLGDVLERYAVALRVEKRNSEARQAERRAARILSHSQRENNLGYTVEASALRNPAD